MTNEEIKEECEKHYKNLRNINDRLEELRNICKHEQTEPGNYSWRIGSIHFADICVYCGTPTKFLNRFLEI